MKTNRKNDIAMKQSIVLSRDVLNSIRSLSREQQLSIVSAIAGEMIFGAVIRDELSNEDMRIYSVIRNDINRDSQHYSCRMTV